MELRHEIQDADLRFAVLSGAHITHRGQGIERFTEAVMQLYRMKSRPDALVLAGDIVYQIDRAGDRQTDGLYDEPYHMVNAVLRRYVDTPVIWANGDGAFGQGRYEEDITADAIQMFRQIGGHELCEHKIVSGYHFITAGIDTSMRTYSLAMEATVRAEIEKAMADGEEKPVFAVLHMPIYGTAAHFEGQHYSAEFSEWIKSQPRVICIVGHSHSPVNDPLAVWQREGGFTTVQAPACATQSGEIPGCARSSRPVPYSQGMLFEVRGATVYVHKLDFMAECDLDTPWEVDVARLLRGEGYDYTERRTELSHAPAFAPKAKLLCKDAGEGRVRVEFLQAACRPAEGSQDGFVKFYRFDFTAVRSGKACASILMCNGFYTRNPTDRFRDTVHSELPAGKYRLTVTPINPFGKEGKPLVKVIRLK